jgi:hypothetical protein
MESAPGDERYALIEKRVLAGGIAPARPRSALKMAALCAAAAVASALALVALMRPTEAGPAVVALAALFGAASAAALWAAVRAGTPAAAPAPWLRRALSAAPLLLLALAAFQRGDGFVWAPGPGNASCLLAGAAAAAPPLLFALWVLAGGSPIAAWLAGAFAGGGAGLAAAGALHVHCPVGEISHVGFFHGGAVLLAALAGALVNVAIWRRRGRG